MSTKPQQNPTTIGPMKNPYSRNTTSDATKIITSPLSPRSVLVTTSRFPAATARRQRTMSGAICRDTSDCGSSATTAATENTASAERVATASLIFDAMVRRVNILGLSLDGEGKAPAIT